MFTVVIGGSGSGKSEYAEELAFLTKESRRIYIATMIAWDEECRQRIAKHRKMRDGKKFETIECSHNLSGLQFPSGRKTVLLECMSNLVSNEMYLDGEDPMEKVMDGVLHLQKQVKNLIIVTNEVFSDGDCYSAETNRYRRILGEVNQKIARRADRVVEVVAGIPIQVK